MNTLPSGWERKKLGDLFEVQLGKMLNKDAKNKYPQYRYLGNSSIRWGSIDTSNLQTMYFSEKEKEKFELINGDILLCEGGDVGRCAIWDKSEKMYYQKALHRLRSKGKIISQFFQNYMLYFSSTKEFENYITKTSIAHLTREKLINIEIKVPPLPEQTKIAEILSTWDKAIQTTEQLLTNSQQQKKVLMQQLLTGKKRLKGFSGEWRKVKLINLLKEEKARNKDNQVTQVLSVTNHSGFVLPEEQFSKRVASEDISNYKIVKKGQFAYNPSRLNVGSFARLDKFSDSALSPMYVVFSIKSKELDSDFFLYWMQSHEAKQRISNSTQGSVRESVGFEALCTFPVALPLLLEQQKIAQILSKQDQEIDTLQQKLACLKQEKKALMQKLLSGKVRV